MKGEGKMKGLVYFDQTQNQVVAEIVHTLTSV